MYTKSTKSKNTQILTHFLEIKVLLIVWPEIKSYHVLQHTF
jgi:hypothetical protein